MIIRHGIKYIITVLFLILIFTAIYPPFSVLLSFIFLFLLIFFRDPERLPEGDGALSPADGIVKRVAGNTVEIFMGIFDCHVNRSPLHGEVVSVEYFPGKFRPAFRDWKDNERRRLIIETEKGTMEILQIAGWFARRIIGFVFMGDNVKRGQKIGMIVFGSRVHVTLPEAYRIVVREGDRVYAGKSIIAREIDGNNRGDKGT